MTTLTTPAHRATTRHLAEPSSPVAGTWPLVRLALRRDRVMIPVWLVLFVVTASSSASATTGLYPDMASRRSAAAAVNDIPALVAFYGRIYDDTSLGALSMMKMSGVVAALVGVFAIILTVRHTRAEEESGRSELVGAGVVGRFAALTAAMITVTLACLALGVLTALGLIGAGLPVAGSVAFGLSWALTGISYAAMTAIAVQVPTGARTATGLACAVLGVTYLLRAVGDTAAPDGPRWASWLSPVGWGQQVRSFAGERWWVLGVSAVFSVLATAIAYVLVTRRDVGSGLVADRAGRRAAGPLLGSPLALAFRLQRGLLIVWTAGLALMGYVLGDIASSIEGFMTSPQAREMFTELGGRAGLTDAFLATDLGFAAVAVSAYGIQAVLRARTEESELRAEPLLAAAVTRRRWLASHLVVAVLGSIWLMLVMGTTAGVAHGVSVGDAGQVARMATAALAHVPSILVLIGIAVAAVGLLPRATQIGWGALVVFLLIGELGPIFKLDQRILDLSPFAHTPKVPGSAFSATPLIWLTLIAIALMIAGIEAFRRRDIG
jgi:ABC-2 type transport system permease protein